MNVYVFLGQKAIDMGLSIAYKGRLKEAKLLPSLLEEIIDIVKIYDWRYTVFERNFPGNSFGKLSFDNIYGVVFSPPECEPLFLTFALDGRLVNPVLLEHAGDKDVDGKDFHFWIVTKTQFAGIEIHKVVIQLLRYISKKYLTDFELHDEGEYWETNDETVLEKNFAKYNMILDKFQKVLKNFDSDSEDDIVTMMHKLIAYIKDKMGDEGFDFEILPGDKPEPD